jgi:hypothetical protein
VSRLAIAAVLCATAFSILMPTQQDAAQTKTPGRNTTLRFVHDFLVFFYPDVMKKGNQLVVGISHPADSSWQEIHGVYFKVVPFSSDEPNPLDDRNSKAILLAGTFWLIPKPEDDRVFQLTVSSEGVHDRELALVRNSVESHPGWSAEQSIQALKAAGARYGPDQKEEFIKAIHVDQAERFLGKITIRSVEFNNISSVQSHVISESLFKWTLVADAEFPDGGHSQYVLDFEPFDGRLVSVSAVK